MTDASSASSTTSDICPGGTKSIPIVTDSGASSEHTFHSGSSMHAVRHGEVQRVRGMTSQTPSLEARTSEPSLQAISERIQESEREASNIADKQPEVSLGLHRKARHTIGTFSKTRFYGRSHWMNSIDSVRTFISHEHHLALPIMPPLTIKIGCSGLGVHRFILSNLMLATGITILISRRVFFDDLLLKLTIMQFETIKTLIYSAASDKFSEMYLLLDKCKKMARIVKAKRPIQQSSLPDFRDYVPAKEISDQLVHLYFRTFESIHRVLHIPSFQREYDQYWINPQATSSAFVVKLLLVMAIGTCFYQAPSSSPSLRFSAVQWIHAAQSWLSSPSEKSRLNVAGLQVHCLLLLARQTNGVGSDLIWISVGSLIRAAMSMGFHLDPGHFPKMSVFQSELRRRLWATILEISVQSSLDSGLLPLISFQDFDCEPPSNIDDQQIDEATRTPPIPKLMNTFTQSSIQIALMRSWRIRLEVVRLLNDFRSPANYEETLHISSEVTTACRANSVLLRSFLSSSSSTEQLQPTAFQAKILDLLTRRFLLSLHLPFADKAKSNPVYHFSRNVCVESSFALLSYSPSSQLLKSNYPDEDYTRLTVLGEGFYRSVFVIANRTICLELMTQLQEDSSPFGSASINSLARKELHRTIEDSIDLAKRRIEAGETNIKGYIFFSGLLGQIDALQAGTSPEQGFMDEAEKSLKICYELMKALVEQSNFQPLQQIDAQQDWGIQSEDEELGLDFLVSQRIAYE
ncbi:hypothetical protein MMC18_007508 [Xylographa bjoerkii]|nr:hypothetical protein [Xylographa bjoerkii]